MPMLADFSVRLACGLAILLLATPWRVVPPAFFRTHCLVILGLLALAALDLARTDAGRSSVGVVIGLAVVGYLATVSWGLGLPRLGVPLTTLIVLGSGGLLIAASRRSDTALWMLDASGRLASAFLMGATLTAMLLGHYYLTAPAMSIAPLRRFVRGMAWGVGMRGVPAAIGLGLWLGGSGTVLHSETVSPLFLAVRWGVGIGGTIVATVLAWKTVEVRSTQSATGILYIGFTLVLFGELTAMALSQGTGQVF